MHVVIRYLTFLELQEYWKMGMFETCETHTQLLNPFTHFTTLLFNLLSGVKQRILWTIIKERKHVLTLLCDTFQWKIYHTCILYPFSVIHIIGLWSILVYFLKEKMPYMYFNKCIYTLERYMFLDHVYYIHRYYTVCGPRHIYVAKEINVVLSHLFYNSTI